MLQAVCEHIHNYFIKDSYDGVYEIADHMISLPLIDGQRFLISGSVLNDGLYTYHDTGIKNDDDTSVVGLQAEIFSGTICALAVPPAVIALAGEINAWVDKYGDIANNPLSGESVIGVYSWTKSTSGNGKANSANWQDVFKSQLDRWRKVAFS